MDLSAPVSYRGYPINSLVENGRVVKGVVIEAVDYSDVPARGYSENRAASDGTHASDVYNGPRRIDMTGFIYEPTLAELFDALHVMRAVFSPTSAYTESPIERGFLPLLYSEPTTKTTSFAGGLISLKMLARPDSNLRFNITRDRLTDKALVDGSSSVRKAGLRPTVISWGARLICKDPRVYVATDKTFPFLGTQATLLAGAAPNRGDYETPLDIFLYPVGTSSGIFQLTGLNGIDMTITVEAKADTIYRWFGNDRVLMTQTGGVSSPWVLRMDLVKFDSVNRKPMIPAKINPSQPYEATFQRKHTVDLAAGSRLQWSEAFA